MLTDLRFASGALPGDDIRLVGVEGVEELSCMYAFDLLLVRRRGVLADDALRKMLLAPCAIRLATRAGAETVHGILETLELIDHGASEDARYLARLVPSLSLLGLSRASRVYQGVTVPAMIEEVLGAAGLVVDEDFEVRVLRDYVEREYVVQYEESTWDFLSRWMEHEGLFYWFEHGARAEKLIIADANTFAAPIGAPETLRYRSRNTLVTADESTVWDLRVLHRRVPSEVLLTDYNHRTPGVRLRASAIVDDEFGFGIAREHGEHFKTNEEGAMIAALRADAHRAAMRTFRVSTDCARMRAGHTFTLDGTVGSDGTYLVTGLRIVAGLPVAPASSLGEGESRHYEAAITALPVDVQYRPPLGSSWPVVEGLVNAHIEADDDGDVADIDEHGRYRVRLPFDASGVTGGKASRWVRMAQPYSGVGYGSHHPLHKGTEVLIAHVHGDPDRPIIVASVPNAHTPGPCTDKNPTQSVVQTPSGIRVEMEDKQQASNDPWPDPSRKMEEMEL